MSITRTTSNLLAVTMLLLLAKTSFAQHLHPFIDPVSIQRDGQFFAPFEMDVYGDLAPANTGWFGTYDRMYIYVTRPEIEQSYTMGDFTWGNRFDLGYMTEEEHGWFVSIMHIDGPTQFDHTTVDRPPAADPLDPLTLFTDLDLYDSENSASFTNVELNKIWRLEPLHDGGIIEPFLGLRYGKFNNLDRVDTFQLLDIALNPVPRGGTGVAFEELTIDKAVQTNQMIMGQLGVRLHKRVNRWILSSEVRGFAGQNFQDLVIDVNTFLDSPGALGGADTGTEIRTHTRSYEHAAEFVIGTEVRAEAAYEVTRDIGIKFGLEFMHIGRGIARSRTTELNDEDVTAVGLTFGAVYNR